MNDLDKQIARPPHYRSSERKLSFDERRNPHGNYNRCPNCGGVKTREAPTCLACKMERDRPPIMADVFVIEGERCRKIPLTQGQYAIVDETIYDDYMRYPWIAVHDPKIKQYYAATSSWVGEKKHRLFLHRAILNDHISPEIDHKNCDTLDNRRSNLRPATGKQNKANRKLMQSNKSGYRGVCWNKDDKKWRSALSHNYGTIYLGEYDDVIEAAKAYDRGALLYHGEFARLNFPQARE